MCSNDHGVDGSGVAGGEDVTDVRKTSMRR
jgi:hypothetical protein